jgi:hypothetical protein
LTARRNARRRAMCSPAGLCRRGDDPVRLRDGSERMNAQPKAGARPKDKRA